MSKFLRTKKLCLSIATLLETNANDLGLSMSAIVPLQRQSRCSKRKQFYSKKMFFVALFAVLSMKYNAINSKFL